VGLLNSPIPWTYPMLSVNWASLCCLWLIILITPFALYIL
jgi:hypothetical protein